MLSITHTTPADGTFSAAGQAAWDDTHTVAGLAAVATSGAYADLSGTPTIISISDVYPVGSIYIETLGVNPATTFGFGTWDLYARGQMIVGFKTGSTEFGSTGQTGGATGVAYTPSGTVNMGLYIPNGTNAAVSFTPSGTVQFPATSPSFQGTTSGQPFTVAVTWPTGRPTVVNATATATSSVTWPTVPTFAGTSHSHQLPFFSTGATGISWLATSKFGVAASTVTGALRVSATATGPIITTAAGSGELMLSNTATAAGIISWPATAPIAQLSVKVSGSVDWPASVPTAMASVSAAGVITWPTGFPAFSAAAQTVPAQTFTGATGSGSAIFGGVAATLDKLPPYIVTFMWRRAA